MNFSLQISGNDYTFWEDQAQMIITSIKKEEVLVPNEYSLHQNYPSTTIEFAILVTEHVTLKVYNALGEKITTLVSHKLVPGVYKYNLDASQIEGMFSGVYYYILKAGKFSQTRKLVYLK